MSKEIPNSQNNNLNNYIENEKTEFKENTLFKSKEIILFIIFLIIIICYMLWLIKKSNSEINPKIKDEETNPKIEMIKNAIRNCHENETDLITNIKELIQKKKTKLTQKKKLSDKQEQTLIYDSIEDTIKSKIQITLNMKEDEINKEFDLLISKLYDYNLLIQNIKKKIPI